MPRAPKRPGPLQDLPLSHFLPYDVTMHTNPFKPEAKRFRSPSASVLLSPAKKRILREERLFPSPDPNRSPSRSRTSDQTPNGTFSPARRLDFGSAKSTGVAPKDASNDHLASVTPRQCKAGSTSTSKRLAPSPDLNVRSAGSRTSRTELDSMVVCQPSDQYVRTAAPILIPRELPPSPNRQSIDYPGFDVHRDTHIELPSMSSRMQRNSTEDSDTEMTKENIPLRVRPKKTMSAPDSLEKTGPIPSTPKSKSKLSTPSTPQDYIRQTPVTPRAHRTPGAMVCIATPSRTPRTGRGSLSNKRALEREVDEHCEFDSTIDETL